MARLEDLTDRGADLGAESLNHVRDDALQQAPWHHRDWVRDLFRALAGIRTELLANIDLLREEITMGQSQLDTLVQQLLDAVSTVAGEFQSLQTQVASGQPVSQADLDGLQTAITTLQGLHTQVSTSTPTAAPVAPAPDTTAAPAAPADPTSAPAPVDTTTDPAPPATDTGPATTP